MNELGAIEFNRGPIVPTLVLTPQIAMTSIELNSEPLTILHIAILQGTIQ